MIIALRSIYHDNGHHDTWSVRTIPDVTKQAHGDPLEGNYLIDEFKKTLKKKLAKIGNMQPYDYPILPEHAIEHGNQFLLKSEKDPRDVLIYAAILVAMNCVMRFV